MKIPRLLKLAPPIALGIGAAAWLISTAEPPARKEQSERSVVARIVITEMTRVRSTVRGYGNVQAARNWEAVAEVAGTVVWRHPDLEAGNVITEGTKVLRIDPTGYELAIAQAEADLTALEADAAQLAVDEANTSRLLALEEDRLMLTEAELARVRDLAERGVAAQSALDAQERTTLQVRRSVAELRNANALVPSRRARLEAQMARTRTILARATRDLDKTDISAPFDLRVSEVHVEHHQFVSAGQSLVAADDIDQAEITAQIPMNSFRRLLSGTTGNRPMTISDLSERFADIAAEVRLVPDPSQTWTGRLVRVESALDPQARSVPAVIAVDDPYAGTNPPLRLPLVPNMYVEVILTGPEEPARITLPDGAIHEGNIVYLRNKEGRLELRTVSVDWRQSGMAVLDGGIAAGEEVVIDDLMPAIPGMIVEPAEVLE
ncbi:efflux RND transporter periplasmic adaptor subunit [Roseovarius sp.]|uniref:efflux RND transporter periplasmic adaptor subunit n=1 Tax=Roseovarius sp. TaxID=1486281 RepID=UPI003A974422